MSEITKTLQLTLETARKIYGKDPFIDALLKDNFSEKELTGKVSKWEDLGKLSGYYIDSDSTIFKAFNADPAPGHINIFATRNQARSVLAMAQLSQLMKQLGEDAEIDWSDEHQDKHCIVKYGTALDIQCFNLTREFLAFRTTNAAADFLHTHKELIKEYFLMFEPDAQEESCVSLKP